MLSIAPSAWAILVKRSGWRSKWMNLSKKTDLSSSDHWLIRACSSSIFAQSSTRPLSDSNSGMRACTGSMSGTVAVLSTPSMAMMLWNSASERTNAPARGVSGGSSHAPRCVLPFFFGFASNFFCSLVNCFTSLRCDLASAALRARTTLTTSIHCSRCCAATSS